jgi:Mal s 1 allergenic protein-like
MNAIANRIAAPLGSLLCVMSLTAACRGEDANPATAQPAIAKATANKPAVNAWPMDKPTVPAALPGHGLAQHDFFYAGEAKTQDMYIVRKGQVDWSFNDSTSKGEISDAVLLSNGNVLFAHQFGVTLINPDRKVLWNFDAPPKTEIHTAQPIGNERVIFIENGPEPKLMVVNLITGKTEKQLLLPVKNRNSTHGQFRHARLTDAGTLLVAHMDLGKIAEYDETGKEIWSLESPSCWSASRLKNGNTLVCCSRRVFEVNSNGEAVWEFTPGDIPDYQVMQFQIATRLPNGNTLINNWVNQWNSKIDSSTAPAQAWEVTPDKQVVWALRSWIDDANLGPATTIQLLDEASVPENVHFGAIE